MITQIVRRDYSLLDVGNGHGLSEDPLHLLCPGLNWHVKDLLAKFKHKPTKYAWINLKNQKEKKSQINNLNSEDRHADTLSDGAKIDDLVVGMGFKGGGGKRLVGSNPHH